ncbi:glycosyltransferase family 2 protein [Marinimicrobium sp. ABcell2]|uniref:glycosyltransferase n=1 Tax=Marinimicrobium sp. ABcell2 TaxID=3069751 RepID=UPI0027AE2DFC|nr:glycosyltransferase [Marinimicrobium sp. ABcell2]MDQ2076168.1 glycosyltransferase [Marinimicrobium sp. ABcell2]
MSVSVIIPAHNEASYIEPTINRLHQVLANRFEYEVIVVENASTDETRSILNNLAKLTVIPVDNKVTVSAARNVGIEAAKFPILAFIDADVLLTIEWAEELERQIDSLQRAPLQITGCRYVLSEQPSWIERSWFAHMRASGTKYINSGNLVTTRQVVDLIKGFDPGLITGEDVDFCGRAAQAGVSLIINERFKAHHEGYPKDLSSFFARELWHGTGDFRSAKTFFRSKVALFSVAITSLTLTSALLLIAGHTMVSISLLGAALFANASAVNSRFRYRFSFYLAIVFLHLVYCFARSTAIFRRQQI